MSRTSRVRQRKETTARAEACAAAFQPVPNAPWWLAAAFLIPNLGALACGFVADDWPLIVENVSLHVRSPRQLAHIWTSGYWPDGRGQGLYRPVSQTLWSLIWAAGGGRHPALFHAAGMILGLAVVLLLFRFLLDVQTPPRTAFITALLFALFPIHTEATTSVVGSAELLAAAFGFSAVLLYYRNRAVLALFAFALAVFSKESAAAFVALPWIFPRKDWRHQKPLLMAGGAAVIVLAALIVHHFVAGGGSVPFVDNPMTTIDFVPRVWTALWVQCLYLFKTVAPITLSADYSYNQIPLVMSLADAHAWAGLGLASGALALALYARRLRAAIVTYAVLFSPTANLLFPMGTVMGERLAYMPSLGPALLLAILLAPRRYWKVALVAVALIFGLRTAFRNLDWLNADRFYTKLAQTSPDSAKAQYGFGTLLAARGDDAGAVKAYDRAIAIFPYFSEVYLNRGNALARLGRRDEAMASYRACLLISHSSEAAAALKQLQAGRPLDLPRQKL